MKFAVWICFVFGFEFVRDTIVSNCRTACAEQFLANQSDRANLHACVSFFECWEVANQTRRISDDFKPALQIATGPKLS